MPMRSQEASLAACCLVMTDGIFVTCRCVSGTPGPTAHNMRDMMSVALFWGAAGLQILDGTGRHYCV